MRSTSTPTGNREAAPEDLEVFRGYVADWLERSVPTKTASPQLEFVESLMPSDEMVKLERGRTYQSSLYDAGLAAVAWPFAYGGGGLTVAHAEIFNDEAQYFDLPISIFVVGLGVCAPTILQCGSEAQRIRHLPSMLRGDEMWCQLFSEPGAGSDLASLRTAAVEGPGGWRVTGQKVWTSGAHYSDFGLLIARTDPATSRHHGLSVFIVPMDSDGVEVRPLRQMTGDAEFNEVFLDDVFVPADNLVGDLNEGWRAVTSSLSHERSAIGSGGGARPVSIPTSLLLTVMARESDRIDEPLVRQLIADVHIRERLLDMTALRVRAARRGSAPGPEGSIGKLALASLATRASSAAMTIRGPAAIAWGDEGGGVWAKSVALARAFSIAGGTNEIQRNVIAERVLGLPR